MAIDAIALSQIERIEKYSFASLFTGDWLLNSDDEGKREKGSNQSKSTHEDVLLESQENELDSDTFVSENDSFKCLICQENVTMTRTCVGKHLEKHK